MRHGAAFHYTTEHHDAALEQDWSARLVISAGFRAEVGTSQAEERSNIKEEKRQSSQTLWDKSS